jgi:hypothetical protein
MLKKACFVLMLVLGLNPLFAQTTFLPFGSEDYRVLDRLETLSGRLCDSLALGDKPESRRNAVNFLESLKSNRPLPNPYGLIKPDPIDSTPGLYDRLSKIEQYNVQQMISENGEWALDEDGAKDSKKAWFKTFYKKQYDFVHVKEGDIFLVINPVLSGIALVQKNTPQPKGSFTSPLLTNSHGAEMRMWISKRLSFYTFFTDNQEQFPYFVNNWATKKQQAVPGADYFLKPAKQFGTYDYMQVSGYMNFDVVRNHVNVTFGMGKHFIGDGISSVFLTDNSSNIPFLQLQARIWKLNYESLYMELTPQYSKGADQILNHKYSTIHYLTWNALRWLNLGFFEAEVFARPNQYELSYLNPIILTTAINRFNGSGDKSMLGFSTKAIVLKRVQLYGQFMLNEFRIKEFTGGKGWYGNKWGLQAGAKYFNAFGIKNLDLQYEFDGVRPYTYTAQDTMANYTNYNQPLADPLGSGFMKNIGLLKYQPVKNLYVSITGTYYVQGVDTGTKNFGNNVFKDYKTADHVYGVSMINGPKSQCAIMNLNLSYQLRRNFFLDIGGTYRKYATSSKRLPVSSTTGTVTGPLTTTYFYFGIRLNAARRDYDFF